MRVCNTKRAPASGTRQIWTSLTRGNLTTPMTVGPFVFPLLIFTHLLSESSHMDFSYGQTMWTLGLKNS